MSAESNVWLLGETDDDDPQRFQKWRFSSEEELRRFLRKHPEVLGDLLIIGSEVPNIEHPHRAVDLLAIDSLGCLWVIELKLGPATRKIMEQTLGYVSWALGATLSQLAMIFTEYSGGGSLTSEFERQFGKTLPGRAEMDLVVGIVAAKVDDHAHCQLATLEYYDFPVRAYEYALLYVNGVKAFQMRPVEFRPHKPHRNA